MSKLRILIADRQRSARSALGMLLDSQPDLDVTAEASDIAELLAQVKTHDPDLIVLDWEIVGQRLEMLLDLLELFDNPPKIVGLSVREEDKQVAEGAGLAGFTYKGDPPNRLLKVIREFVKSRK